MASKLSKAGEKVGAALFYLHLLGFTPSFLYFNYCYAREHGFVSWLLLGMIVPTLKALVWEYFVVAVLLTSPGPYAEDEMHYLNSREANNIAAQFLTDIQQQRSLSEEEKTEVLEYLRRAYTEAQAVRHEYLDAIHPEFRKHYRDEYQESLRLNLQAREREDRMAAIKAYRLQNQWTEWLQKHAEELDFP